ncbi:MAG TPA: 1-deoxy-D-xylulose-5-phosphate synthase, partial [Negativicutes bacterium]|nr:1-deoxy-D-xylulose-5-phosphate synthase [Negativicutes bacterium]
IIQTVSRNGGHLASNLGVVELTLALHKVFDTPRDRIVFDVGHQSYVHKILTGRRDRFDTLRTYKGICGFPRREESVHDAFGAGHSSTSISAALGIALARDMRGETHKVIAVIGDGSLTGGMAFEGLNHAGHLNRDLIVVLNDNEMSISKNVGAMSHYLAKMRLTPTYSWAKHNIEFFLRRIPAIGESVANTAERMKDSVKYLLVPGMFFEELGFTYLGPIDGHDLPLLVEVMEKAKSLRTPVLVHVLTQKGKGYPPAECQADKFHGVGPFCVESGKSIKGVQSPTYTSVFGDAMIEMAERVPNMVGITAAMSDGTGLDKFAVKYPDRFFDVGIAEQHAVTMAAGLASQGMRPVVTVYSTFSQRAFDSLIHDVCLQDLPVILALDRAGLVGEDGPTHHGAFDLSFSRLIPNLTIMAPKDEAELRDMLYTALHLNGPVLLRYPRGRSEGFTLSEKPTLLPVGQGEWLRQGSDLVFWAVGTMVQTAVKASEILETKGIRAGVVNARFIKPLDEALLIKIAKRARWIVTVEENSLMGGFGSAVLESLNCAGIVGNRVLRLGLPDCFVEQGSREELLDCLGLTPVSIAERVCEFIGVDSCVTTTA